MIGRRNQVVKVLVKAMVCLAFIGFFTTKSYGQLGLPPVIAVGPLVLSGGSTVTNGDTAILSVTVVSLTTPTFTWYCNGSPITKGTLMNSNGLLGLVDLLIVNGMAPTNAGAYTVKIKNASGTTTSGAVNLSVLVPPVATLVSNVVNIVSSATKMTTSGFKLQLSVPANSNIVIHASSDLMHWTPIYTNSSTTGTLDFTDTNALHVTSRFYRAEIR